MLYNRIIFLPLNISKGFALFISSENTNGGIITITEVATFIQEVIRALGNLDLNKKGKKKNTV